MSQSVISIYVRLEKSFPMPEFVKRITKNGTNEGNYAKIKEILLQPSSIWGEMLAKFIRHGIRERV